FCLSFLLRSSCSSSHFVSLDSASSLFCATQKLADGSRRRLSGERPPETGEALDRLAARVAPPLPAEPAGAANAGEWDMFYRFPYIGYARLACKAKIYQTAVTGALVGLTVVHYATGAVPFSGVVWCTGASVFACGMLYVFGNIFSRVVGFAYISSNR